jgi:hypothetical protein
VAGSTTTLDVIHVALERLGYTGDTFSVRRIHRLSYAIYRRGSESVLVRWPNQGTTYELSALTVPLAQAIAIDLTAMGLTCESNDTCINVRGQEHIDAEVRKMLDGNPPGR